VGGTGDGGYDGKMEVTEKMSDVKKGGLGPGGNLDTVQTKGGKNVHTEGSDSKAAGKLGSRQFSGSLWIVGPKQSGTKSCTRGICNEEDGLAA